MSIQEVLELIRLEAEIADTKAEQACLRSKYSIQDYWLCVEFKMQQLHDQIARQAGLEIRCPHYQFRQKVNRFRKHLLAGKAPTEQEALWEAEQ